MFCPTCGNQIPDGSPACPACGTQFAAPQQPMYHQPMYQQPPMQRPVYQQPMYQQPPMQPQQAPQNIPWHSRGKLSAYYPGAKKINIAFVAALTVFQAVLFVIFGNLADTVETDMLIAQIVGAVPTIVLVVYLFCLDTIEKEPPQLLFTLFSVEGGLTLAVVGLVEYYLIEGLGWFLDDDTILFHIIENLICVALVEEGFKYAVLKKFTWHHPAFNYRFDGIVYAAVTALGFAAFENSSYISEYGFGTALIRTISAVPGHCVDGILMGIFYGQAKLLEGRGDRAGSFKYRIFALLAPIAEHGFYDFFANIGESDLAYIVFYAYVFLLNAVVFVLVWRLAQKDEAIYSYDQQAQYAMW